jgi:hypothetical protein
VNGLSAGGKFPGMFDQRKQQFGLGAPGLVGTAGETPCATPAKSQEQA